MPGAVVCRSVEISEVQAYCEAIAIPSLTMPLLHLRHALLALTLFLFSFSLLISRSFATLVNERVAIAVDATGPLAQVQTHVRVRNDGPNAVSTVTLILPNAERRGPLVVAEGAELGRKVIPLTLSHVQATVEGVPDHSEAVNAVLSNKLDIGEAVDLLVAYDLTHAIVLSPIEIRENESQYVRFEGDAYYTSPYFTESVETAIKLASASLIAKPTGPVPFSVSKSTLKLGPYVAVPPMSSNPISARFQNNKGFLVADEAIREMYVSHWGNVAVKEELKLRNAGAKFIGRWSRIDYTSSPSAAAPAIADVWANLPRESTTILYKDLIGNITTSRLRKPNKKNRPAQFSFRFPLLGGWKNHFWYTYDVPLSGVARSKASSHVLRIPVFPTINERFLCHRLVVRVMLPEGASSIDVLPHATLGFKTEYAVQRKTLNYFGRTVVTLTTNNVQTFGAPHAPRVEIKYNFSRINLLVSPLIVVAGIFGMFLIFIVYLNTDVVLVSDKDDPRSRAVLVVTDQRLRVTSACDKMSALYAGLDVLFDSLESERIAMDVGARRMALESDLKSLEADISAASSALSNLGSGSASIAAAIAVRYASKRDVCMRAIAARKMLLEGRMKDEDYTEQMSNKIGPVVALLTDEIEALSTAITDEM
jgi:oligosaccharyltransferase complex subunit alpha (ribophorin I)